MLKKRILQTILISFFLYSIAIAANTDSEVNYNDKIKAVFVYNFTKYIQWPAADTSKVFTIGVFGKSNILISLQKIAQKKLVKGRKIIIKQFEDIDTIEECQILFVSSQEDGLIPDILHNVEYKNILTVSEVEKFSDTGGIINLVLVEGKIKFEMNLKALHRAGLLASSQLLKLAILVEENE